MKGNILVVNPKDMVTQIAVYDNYKLQYINNRRHWGEELAGFESVYDQIDFRKELIMKEIAHNNVDISEIKIVISRGGLVKPVHSGVYEVNDVLEFDLRNSPIGVDVINIGGLVARAVAAEIPGSRAMIADPTVVDEMQDVARITGVPGIARKSIFHALNQKAIAKLYADSLKKEYSELNLIVAHLGNGTTVGAHCKGKVIDVNQGFEGDGPFSMIRCGSLPLGDVARMCSGDQMKKNKVFALLSREGGIKAHLGTTDIREIETRLKNGDRQASLIIEAMAYQVSKSIGEMFAALKGEADAILLTGDLVHLEEAVTYIRDHVEKFAQVIVYPGDNEIQAMASNAMRVIKGEIEVTEYR